MAEPTNTSTAIPKTMNRTWLLVTLALGILLNPLNSSMIAVALSRIQNVFHLNFDSASWLISTYYLASAISQPVMGKLADTLGRKRIFLIGLILVAVSCATAPFSPSFAWLIVLRLIQSIGSGAIYPAGMGIVRKYVTEGQAKALATLSIFSSGAAAFGPSIGGLLIHFGDWPSIFWVNFPVIVGSVALGIFMLPIDNPERRPFRDIVRRVDIFGIMLFSLGIIFALWFLLSIVSTLVWWAGCLAVLLFLGFVFWELRSKEPFIDVRMFRKNMPLSWVLIQFATVNVIFYSVFFGMPTYLQEVRHLSAGLTGLVMLCVAGFGLITAPIAGRWVEKSGSRPPLLLAGLCMTVGSALYLTLHEHAPLWWLCVVLTILGLSGGFNNVGLQTALFRVTPQPIISAASGLFQTARYLGTILSTVLLGMLFGRQFTTNSLHVMGIILAVIGVVVMWMSWRLPKSA